MCNFVKLATSATNAWTTVNLSDNLSKYKLIAVTVFDDNTFSSYIWAVENFKGTSMNQQFGGNAPTGKIGLAYYVNDTQISLYIASGTNPRIDIHGLL